MQQPVVEITVAVHTSTRPIARAVGSILDSTAAAVGVIVVAHNIDEAVIRENLGKYADDGRVRLLHLADGIPSPAGPMNHGLAASTAPWVGVMGSDDEFEPGAIDSWLALADQGRARMVMARIRHAGGANVPSPPARPFRRTGLDSVKDRLSYRAAPLGIVSREAFPDLRFTEGLSSGEDLPYVSTLWFSGQRIAFDRTGPAYLVHADAEDRVTSAPRPVADDFAFLDHIFGQPLFEALGRRHRTALAIKLLRSNLFDAVVNRAPEPWGPGERDALAAVARRILDWGRHPEHLLSRLDRIVLDGVLDGTTDVEVMMDAIRKRWNYRSPAVVLPRNPLYALHRQAPLRTYIGGYLV